MSAPVGPVAAWVGDQVITVAEVDERVAALRRGPHAARLPHPETAEGRTLRRWVVQVATTEAVVAHEVARRAIPVTEADEPSRPRGVTLREALGVGGVVAAVLAAQPAARALRRQLTTDQLTTEQLTTEQLTTEQLTTEQLAAEQLAAEQLTTEQLAAEQPVRHDQARDYYDRNRDRYPGPYQEVREQITAELAVGDRDRAFARWLESRAADLVRLAPGFEHPGDPGHPDAVHHH